MFLDDGTVPSSGLHTAVSFAIVYDYIALCKYFIIFVPVTNGYSGLGSGDDDDDL